MEGKSLLPGLWHQPSSSTTLPCRALIPPPWGLRRARLWGTGAGVPWEEVGGFGKPWELGYRWF